MTDYRAESNALLQEHWPEIQRLWDASRRDHPDTDDFMCVLVSDYLIIGPRAPIVETFGIRGDTVLFQPAGEREPKFPVEFCIWLLISFPDGKVSAQRVMRSRGSA